MAHPVGRELGPESPGARDEIGLAGQDRLDHAADLFGLVLAVGVDRRNHLRAAGAREPVAELQRRALAAIDGNVAHERAGAGRLGGCRIASAVDDHDHIELQTGGLARDLLDHAGDRRLLVVGGDHDRERRSHPRRVRRKERHRCPSLLGREALELGVDREGPPVSVPGTHGA